MPNVRYLKNAPISEALIDFRVQLPSGFDIKKFIELKKSLPEFPIMEEQQKITSGIEFNSGNISQFSTSNKNGVIFKSADNLDILQFRLNGFTFNRLKPYKDWNYVIAQTKKNWLRYLEISGIKEITRIAVRYLNNIPISSVQVDLSKILNTKPCLPENIPNRISGFFNRISIQDNEHIQNGAHITQAINKKVNADNAELLIDIDAFCEKSFDALDNKVWGVFEQLRNLKNTIFFNLLTEDKLKEFE
jgi:uncharacterized protein (TIGR04255 family)